MENGSKNLNLVTIVGIIVNVLAVIFVGYIYFTTAPKAIDLKVKQVVRVPQVQDVALEGVIAGLNRPETLPIYVDPNAIGKTNPYN